MSYQQSPDPPGLRASDAERDEAAEALRRHHAEGRLGDDEFEERIERCYQARTVAQLDRLLVDLPTSDRRPGRGEPIIPRGRPGGLPIVAIVVGFFLLMGLLGSIGGYYRHHHYYGWHPPLLLLAPLAFIAYRLFVARRR